MITRSNHAKPNAAPASRGIHSQGPGHAADGLVAVDGAAADHVAHGGPFESETAARAAPFPASAVDADPNDAAFSDARPAVVGRNDKRADLEAQPGAAPAGADPARPSAPGPDAPQTASDKAWEETLAKPANQSALARLAESLRGFAAGGVFGKPELMSTTAGAEETTDAEIGVADQPNPADSADTVDRKSKPRQGHSRRL